MKILVAIVHYWDPDGGGLHQSLRPDPTPRVEALQQQLLHLRRLGSSQSYLDISELVAYPANKDIVSDLSISVVTDGKHHVLDLLPESFRSCFDEIVVKPKNGKMLGFEVQNLLAANLSNDYDWFGYIEDDILIHDPFFFAKLQWFEHHFGPDAVLLPQRVEFSDCPNRVDRFYIDGPLAAEERNKVVVPGPVRLIDGPAGQVAFEPALNPHAGCFFLSRRQLNHWVNQSHWQDGDVSFISPLESAATLGISKTFSIFKPCLSTAGWLEVQHFGTSFLNLLSPSPT